METVVLQQEFRELALEQIKLQAISRAELARRMGVPAPMVTRYLNGEQSPGADVIERFFIALGFQPHLSLKPAAAPLDRAAS